MEIARRDARRRLTRKDRRRPVRYAVGVAALTATAGLAAGALHPAAGAVAAAAVAAGCTVALLIRDLTELRLLQAEQHALAVLLPLREGQLYPLNPASLCPENMLLVCRQLVERRPRWVLELGSGSSTVLMARCLQRFGGAESRIVALEHLEPWVESTRRLLDGSGARDLATVLHAPRVEGQGWEHPYYDLSVLPPDAGPFEVVLVDGPEGGSRDPLARGGVLPLLRDRLAPDAVLLLDDGLREGERDIVRRWQEQEPGLRARLVNSYTGMWILELPGEGRG